MAIDAFYTACQLSRIFFTVVDAGYKAVLKGDPSACFVKIISATEDKVFVVEAIGYAPDENTDMYGFYEDDNTKYNTEEIFCIQLDEEFGNTLNGRDVWELFDGLMYAG